MSAPTPYGTVLVSVIARASGIVFCTKYSQRCIESSTKPAGRLQGSKSRIGALGLSDSRILPEVHPQGLRAYLFQELGLLDSENGPLGFSDFV